MSSKYWDNGVKFKEPDDELLRQKAERSIERAAAKGQKYDPVVVDSDKIANNWWSIAWCENLERYSDFKSRIGRGRHYVEIGTVIDMKIEKGRILARVQGTRAQPYKTEIRISPLSEAKCQAIIEKCGRKIESLEKVLAGDFPEEMKDIFLGEDGLFPTPWEISFNCSCPDWALMCKHVVAALYGVAVRFDEDPLLFFELRGIDVNRFIDITLQNKVEVMLSNVGNRTSRMMDDADDFDLESLFGML